MEILKQRNDKELTLILKGELNTVTAFDLDKVVASDDLKNVQTLIFDMAELSYLTSAGLRVLLVAQRLMNDRKGKLIVRHVNEAIMEVFTITGFNNVLTIEA